MSRIIPTYENGKWDTTEFNTDADFREYLEGIFKEPGEYGFTKLALKFNEQARIFNKEGFYCNQRRLKQIGYLSATNGNEEPFSLSSIA